MLGSRVLDTSVIDLLRSLRSDGGPNPIAELSETWVIESAARMRQLTAAVESGDHTGVRRAAHCMKGMSGTVGAMQLSEMFREVEHADAGTVDRTRITMIEEEIGRVSDALNTAARSD